MKILSYNDFVNESQSPVEEVAQEFYDYLIEKWGKPGKSAFNTQIFKKFFTQSSIIYFPETEREHNAHICPVYKGYVLDFSKDFNGGLEYRITPVNSVMDFYGKKYDIYILGKTFEEIEKKANTKIETIESLEV